MRVAAESSVDIADRRRRDRRERPRLGGRELDNGPPRKRQHQARGAGQLITSAIDAHVQGEQHKDGEGPAEVLAPRANDMLMARKINYSFSGDQGASNQNQL